MILHKICYIVSTNSSKGSVGLPTIAPVFDLRNYGNVLEKRNQHGPIDTGDKLAAYTLEDVICKTNSNKDIVGIDRIVKSIYNFKSNGE